MGRGLKLDGPSVSGYDWTITSYGEGLNGRAIYLLVGSWRRGKERWEGKKD